MCRQNGPPRSWIGATPVKNQTMGDSTSGTVQSGAKYAYMVDAYMRRCHAVSPRTASGFARRARSIVPLAYLKRWTVQERTSWGDSIRVSTRGW